ncbi:MAG: ATP-binding cassette domain-containing protein [Pseudomonadota bacterium]
MGAAAIAALGLTKHYAGKPVLRGASGVFRRGELTAILGKRGAGRTTLSAILAGQRLADGGRVWRGGSVAPLVGHSAGFGATGSIRRDLGLRAAAAGLCGRRFAAAVAAELGAPALLDRSFERLEGPSRAALCHAAAWLVPADIYIADGALTPNVGPGAEAIAARLAERRQHAAVIWLTAGVTSLRAVAPDRILLLEQGMLRPLADIEEAIAVFDERRRLGPARAPEAKPATVRPSDPPAPRPTHRPEATAGHGGTEQATKPAAGPRCNRTKEGSSAVLSAGTVLRLSLSDVAPPATAGAATPQPESQGTRRKQHNAAVAREPSNAPRLAERLAKEPQSETPAAKPTAAPPAPPPAAPPGHKAKRATTAPQSPVRGPLARAEDPLPRALAPAYRTLFKGRRPRETDHAEEENAGNGARHLGQGPAGTGQGRLPQVTVSAAPPGALAP